jgi:hypothetical protein
MENTGRFAVANPLHTGFGACGPLLFKLKVSVCSRSISAISIDAPVVQSRIGVTFIEGRMNSSPKLFSKICSWDSAGTRRIRVLLRHDVCPGECRCERNYEPRKEKARAQDQVIVVVFNIS